jgi:hypothetical protein
MCVIPSYRHQLNHTPKQIYNCDFPDCHRIFVRQDLCNRHKERHTARGSQLQRKDSMMNSVPNSTDGGKTLSLHGISSSPETTRSATVGSMARASQLQYPSPPDNSSSPFSSATMQSATTLTGSASSTGTDFSTYQQSAPFKRSNSDHSLPLAQSLSRPDPTHSLKAQRHSFGVADAKPPLDGSFSRQPIQASVGPYGLLSSASTQQPYLGNHSQVSAQTTHPPYVNQQNFAPFTLPPPGFSATATTSSARDMDQSYAISPPQTTVQMDYQRDTGSGQQSGPDMMLLDQMTVPHAMPVFGGEGYSRSPFAIPDDFVAYLFSGQQFENSSPMIQPGLGHQGYAK